MEIIMKKLFIILLVFNSVLFSQWESIEINPVNGLLFSFHMSDSLNLTAVFMDDTCYVIKSSDGGKELDSYAENSALFDRGCYYH
jgi:hypothetical protein